MSTQAGSGNRGKGKVRLVLFDVFDTLCTPRIPVHEQYYEEAISAGIPSSCISPEGIRSGFKPAFKEMNAQYPLYGKLANPPISPEEWWSRLIESCVIHAGASEADARRYIPKMVERLLERFESDHGYRLFPDSLPCLTKLREMGVKTSVVSNADPRILKTLEALNILPLLSYPPTLSWEVESSKPDPRIFDAACKACGEDAGEGVLMVGDELVADYHGAMSAGLEGRLVRRDGEWSDGAMRSSKEDLSGVHVITGLDDIVQEVESRNQPP